MSNLTDNERFPIDPGTEIRLADGRNWSFPGPLRREWQKDASPPAEYLGILEMILESQDKAELQRSKLALAIFLLGINYDLAPINYVTLLSFGAGSPDSAAWQAEFDRIVEDHLQEFVKHHIKPRSTTPKTTGPRGWLSRISARLRSGLRFEKWFLKSGSHNA